MVHVAQLLHDKDIIIKYYWPDAHNPQSDLTICINIIIIVIIILTLFKLIFCAQIKKNRMHHFVGIWLVKIVISCRSQPT